MFYRYEFMIYYMFLMNQNRLHVTMHGHNILGSLVHLSIVNSPYLCSNIPSLPVYGVYLTADSLCKSLFNIS
jgi:hypothetical protein